MLSNCMHFCRFFACSLSMMLVLVQVEPIWAQTEAESKRLAFDIYKELVEINTTTATGDTELAANAMATRLKAFGFGEDDVQVFKPAARKGNLVARLHGNGLRKPILLLAHLDVVPAKREDWSFDPFKLTEQDGYVYGRGASDDKFMAAAFVATLIRYKQEGYKPDRDIIVALETDEEILDADGVGIRWLLANHRDLIDAEFALNEGGNVGLKAGKPVRNSVQTSEKISISYQLEIKNRGGHSSLPTKDNAIYRLAAGLVRLSEFTFPLKLNDTTKAYFERAADWEGQQLAADIKSVVSGKPDPASLSIVRLSVNPVYNAQLRTTCVATMLEGGHAVNALPQMARAKVNCRVFPGEAVSEVKATLERVLADEQITVTQIGEPIISVPSALNQEIMDTIKKVTEEMWPGMPVVPSMSAGATDGSALRNAGIPTYGHSGLPGDIDDVRAHGKDERVLIKAFYEGLDYQYRLIKALSGGH
jgi:acetylornithine deacetylase/succinyl-diaminopimelate desuccinylase-like protein